MTIKSIRYLSCSVRLVAISLIWICSSNLFLILLETLITSILPRITLQQILLECVFSTSLTFQIKMKLHFRFYYWSLLWKWLLCSLENMLLFATGLLFLVPLWFIKFLASLPNSAVIKSFQILVTFCFVRYPARTMCVWYVCNISTLIQDNKVLLIFNCSLSD